MKRKALVANVILGLFGGICLAKAAGPIQYLPKEKCSLCGNPDNNILDIYNQGIGIINFNALMVTDLDINAEAPDSSGSSTSISHAEDGSTIYINSNKDRRFAYVKIDLDNSMPDKESMVHFLCKQCIEDICMKNTYDVAFIDYRTRTIIPIGFQIETYMEDYVAIEMSRKQNEIEYIVFYAPEQ